MTIRAVDTGEALSQITAPEIVAYHTGERLMNLKGGITKKNISNEEARLNEILGNLCWKMRKNICTLPNMHHPINNSFKKGYI